MREHRLCSCSNGSYASKATDVPLLGKLPDTEKFASLMAGGALFALAPEQAGCPRKFMVVKCTTSRLLQQIRPPFLKSGVTSGYFFEVPLVKKLLPLVVHMHFIFSTVIF